MLVCRQRVLLKHSHLCVVVRCISLLLLIYTLSLNTTVYYCQVCAINIVWNNFNQLIYFTSHSLALHSQCPAQICTIFAFSVKCILLLLYVHVGWVFFFNRVQFCSFVIALINLPECLIQLKFTDMNKNTIHTTTLLVANQPNQINGLRCPKQNWCYVELLIA